MSSSDWVDLACALTLFSILAGPALIVWALDRRSKPCPEETQP